MVCSGLVVVSGCAAGAGCPTVSVVDGIHQAHPVAFSLECTGSVFISALMPLGYATPMRYLRASRRGVRLSGL